MSLESLESLAKGWPVLAQDWPGLARADKLTRAGQNWPRAGQGWPGLARVGQGWPRAGTAGWLAGPLLAWLATVHFNGFRKDFNGFP